MTAPVVLSEDDDLLIKWLPGSSHHLVLAFTGIKHSMGGLPSHEFIGSASNKAGNHVLFISDLKRSWYSGARLTQKIITSVKNFMAKHQITETTAIGNSMGGYGAILFSADLPIKRVIAFAPQISMHPEVLLETRWIEHRRHFGAALPTSLRSAISNSKARFFVFFGRDSVDDAAQAGLIPEQDSVSVFKLRGCGHNVAAFLKNNGLLTAIFADVFNNDGARVSTLVEGHV